MRKNLSASRLLVQVLQLVSEGLIRVGDHLQDSELQPQETDCFIALDHK